MKNIPNHILTGTNVSDDGNIESFWSNGGRRMTDRCQFSHRPEELKSKIINWLKENILVCEIADQPRELYSFVLRCYMEKELGSEYHMTNNEIKGALLHTGIEPVNKDNFIWIFKISDRSPIFKKIDVWHNTVVDYLEFDGSTGNHLAIYKKESN